MHPDAGLLLVARVLRNFSYGYLVVVVGIYLDQLGLTPIEVGAVLTASAAGSAALTIGWSLLADRIGRRRSIRVLSLLMVAGGLTFVITSDPWLLALAAFAGSLSVAGTDTGTFVTVDQSMLPQVSADHRRTSTFALQNMFATLAVAVGSLAAGAVPLLARIGLQGPDAYRPLFVLYAGIGLLNLLQSIVAYWFYLVWRLDASTLALLFFWMNVLSALSMLAAGAIARRIGLFNTMLLTHIPQGVFGVLMPFAPTAWLAMAFWLVRNTIGFAYFPVRLSYVMGIVPPAERSAAAGYTTVARNVAGMVTPALAGLAFSLGLLGLPFIISGLMKLSFDALSYATLRNKRPPEERIAIEEIAAIEGASGSK